MKVAQTSKLSHRSKAGEPAELAHCPVDPCNTRLNHCEVDLGEDRV